VDDRVEQILRASRPEPDPDYVESLELRLLRPARRERRPARPLFAGAALAGALASAVLALSLAGVGPLGGGSDGAHAGSDCKFVTVAKREKAPVLVQGQLVLREHTVYRRIKRCS
jgi:hypothetical protein